MTDTTEPSTEAWQALATATAAAIEADEQPDAAAEPTTEDQHPDENPNAREARYRIQLRETEVERDQLRANVVALQRAEVERIASKSIQKPAALWSANVELAQLLDDTGTVDPRKVDTAVKQAKESLGLAQTRPGGYVRSEGQVIDSKPAGDPWKEAFKG